MDRLMERWGGIAHGIICALFALVLAVSLMPSSALGAETSQDGLSTPESGTTSGTDPTGENSEAQLLAWDGSVDTSWYNTTDTEFTLISPAQLAGLAAITSTSVTADQWAEAWRDGVAVASKAEGISYDNFAGKTVKLGANFDLKSLQFNPIADFNVWGGGGGQGGTAGTYDGLGWAGTLDGCGHVIYNLNNDGSLNCSENFGGYQGLVSGIIKGGVVRNLGVTGYVKARVGGGIVGASNLGIPELNDEPVAAEESYTVTTPMSEWPRIENCWADVEIVGNGSGSRGCGAIFGGEGDYRSQCSVINCYATGTVKNTTSGGIAGFLNGDLAGCYSTVNVSGTNTGALVATLFTGGTYDASSTWAARGSISNCMALQGTNSNFYRWASTASGTPTAVTDGFSTKAEIQAGASTLGCAFVAREGGYPALFWENDSAATITDISGAKVTLSASSFGFTANWIEPEVAVVLSDTTLVQGRDYVVVYANNIEVGSETATATVYGVGRYAGQCEPVKFSITQIDLSECEVSKVAPQWWYGEPVEPVITVTAPGGTTLVNGTDYTVTYANNDAAGTATITIDPVGLSTKGQNSMTFTLTAASSSLEGSGTAEDPWIIASKSDWQFASHMIDVGNEAYRTGYYKAGADFSLVADEGEPQVQSFGAYYRYTDAEGKTQWVRNYFAGSFDGDGHTITVGFTVSERYSSECTAPFAYVGTYGSKAANLPVVVIKNLTVAGSVAGYNSAGFVSSATAANLVMENCVNKADVTNKKGSYLAGLVSQFGNGTITNCVNEGSITGAAGSYAAGIVAHQNTTGMETGEGIVIADCENRGSVTLTSSGVAAGILGNSQVKSPLSIVRCLNAGDITAKSYAGGIVGSTGNYGATADLSIVACANAGQVKSTSSYAGGIIATLPYGNATVSSCLNIGKIVTDSTSANIFASGIAGAAIANASSLNPSQQVISRCYNAGELEGASVAGILGYANQRYTTFTLSSAYLAADGVSAFGKASTNAVVDFTACQAFSADDLKAVPEILGAAFVTDDEDDPVNGGWPVLWWQAGLENVDLSIAVISSITDQMYTGSAIVPTDIKVTLGDTELVYGADYMVSATNNVEVGEAALTVTGVGIYKGSVSGSFKIVAQDLASGTQSVDQTTLWCAADQPAEPLPTVKNAAGSKMALGTDYELSYRDNTSTGAATVVITGKGSYEGSVELTYPVVRYELLELEGSGTVADPYIISTVAEWQFVAGRLNVDAGAYAGAAYKLGNDLVLEGRAGDPAVWAWGSSEQQVFYGIFDGAGHTVTVKDRATALFAYVNGATIRDLTVSGTAKMESTSPFVSFAYGDVVFDGCTNKVDIAATNNSVSGFVAHAVGDVVFRGCANYGSIVTSNTYTTNFGGLVAWAKSGSSVAFKDCSNHGDIRSSASAATFYNGKVGGFVGVAENSSISLTRCYNTGNIKGSYSSSSFVGQAEASDLRAADCYNVGTLEVYYKWNAADSGAGAVVGSFIRATAQNELSVSNFYNAGSVVPASGNGSWAYGSLFGFFGGDASMEFSNLYWLEGSAGTFSGHALTEIANATTCLTADEMKIQGIGGLAFKLGAAFSDDSASVNNGFPILGGQRIDVSAAYPIAVSDQEYTGTVVEPEIKMLYVSEGLKNPTVLKRGSAFEVIYSDNIDLGTATAKIVGVGSYTGTTTLEFNIVAGDIANCVIAPVVDQVIKGQPVEPEVSVVSSAGIDLVAGVDYDVIYRNNDIVGTATALIVGKGNFTGQAQVPFNVVAGSLEDVVVGGVEDFYDYTGEPIEIVASLVDEDDKTLVEGVDYEASIVDSEGNAVSEVQDKGSYAITFTGIGSYTGQVVKEFSVGKYMSVYTQEGSDGTPVLVKEYTKAEFEALKANGGQAISGMYYKSGSWNVTTASEYVTIDALLADAGLSGQFVEGTSLKADCNGFASELSFEDAQAKQSFYPDLSKDGTQATEARTGQVPVFSLRGASSVVETTAADAEEKNIAAATSKEAPRFIYGMSDSQVGPEPDAAGKRFVSNCDSLTLILPEPVVFTVNYRQGDDGDLVVAKEYTASDLKVLAKQDRDPVSGMFYKSDTWKVVSTDWYVTLEELFEDAGVGLLWNEDAKLLYGGDDPEQPEKGASTFTYSELMKQGYFYPEARGSESLNPETWIAAPPVLSVTEYSSDTSESKSAAEAEAENLAAANVANFPRLIYGISEEVYRDPNGGGTSSMAGGWRYWSNNKQLTIVAPAADPVDPVDPADPVDPEPSEGTDIEQIYDDVDGSAWYADAVAWAYDEDVMTGSNGSFDPDGTLTRAMAARVLWNAAGQPEASSASGFSDVAEGKWYADAIAWAAEVGVVTGYKSGGEPTGEFGPDDLVTREQLAVMMARYAAWAGVDVVADTSALATFPDAGKVSDYAEDAMAWCVSEGIITGISGTYLEPQGDATRAQMATMAMRLMEGVLA